jgi:ribosomal protein S1
VKRPEEAVRIGDEVEVKILRVLPEEQRIGLSIREVQLAKEREKIKEIKEKEEEARKVTIGDIVKEKLAAKELEEQKSSEGGEEPEAEEEEPNE